MSKNQSIISVGLDESFVPVKIGELDFKLYTSDEKQAEYTRYINELQENQVYFENKAKALEESSTPEEKIAFFKETKESAKKTVDFSLGDGAFDLLYEKSGGSTTNVCNAFFEVMVQFQQLQQKKRMNSIVSGKKRR